MDRRGPRSRRRRRQYSPWATGIPTEILGLIASKCVTTAVDYVLYRQHTLCHVCHEWRRSLTDFSPYPPAPSPHVPFLLLPRPSANLETPLGYVFTPRFLLRWPNRCPETYCLPQIAETHGRICVGSSHGWLIILGRTASISLLNPVTRDCFRLPPLFTINNTVLSFNRISLEYHLPQKGLFFNQTSIIRRVVLSSDPAIDSGFTVILFISGLTECFFACARKSKRWSQHMHDNFLVEDVIFFKGSFIVVDLSLNFLTFDINTGLVKKQLKSTLSVKQAFLVDAAGRLLLVVKVFNPNQQRFVRCCIQVDEMLMTGDEHVLMPIRNIHSLSECSLFIGHGCSVCVSTRLFPLLPEGKVYFPHFYATNKDDKAGQPIILHHAGVYEFTLESTTTRKKFVVENREVNAEDRSYAHSRFFWVTPNLHPKLVSDDVGPVIREIKCLFYHT